MSKVLKSISDYMREIEVNGSEGVGSSIYITNYIRSNKYTVLSLLPLNLYEQFHRYPNIWYLIVCILQLSPLSTEASESYTTLVPFVCVLLFTLFKDTYQDIYRRRADSVSNDRTYFVWDGLNYSTELCKNLKVGQIVLVREGDFVPADMVLIAAADLDQICYIDTSQILGETRLECKKAINETQSMIEHSDTSDISAAIRRINGTLTIEQPNSNLFKFEGKFKIRGNPKAISLSIENLVLRSSYVAYTPWMLGVVIYTGFENKLLMNSLSIKRKSSRLEKYINQSILMLMAVIILLVLVCVLANEYLYKDMNYTEKDTAAEAILNSFVYFNQIIPISLFLTLDIAKALQSVYISRVMKYQVNFKTSDLNEDLGSVEYILANKSGTITNQKLKLRACSVGNSIYWKQDIDLHTNQEDSKVNIKCDSEIITPTLDKPKYKSELYDDDFLDFDTLKSEVLNNEPESAIIQQLVTCMAICNSVQPIPDVVTQYFSTSNEEYLLVQEARDMGIKLVSKSNNVCITHELGKEVEYEMLAYKQFSHQILKSRMVVKKNFDEGAYFYVKGDPQEVKRLCNLSIEEENRITGHLAMLSLQGLRTMAFAYRFLSSVDLEEFIRRLEQARIAPVNNEARIELVFFDYEKDFKFLGTSAFEEIVPEENKQAIQLLQKAGIKLWMTSADSRKNCMAAARNSGLIPMDLPVSLLTNLNSEFQAIQMLKKGFSKYVFHDNSEVISSENTLIPVRKITQTSKRSSESAHFSIDSSNMFKGIEYEISSLSNFAQIDRSPIIRNFVRRNKAVHPFLRKFTKIEVNSDNILSKPLIPSSVKFAVIMDGISLDTCISDEKTKQLLVTYLFAAQTVVFARLNPSQKATLVRILKQNMSFKPVVMAIGDSYCDLAMMQEADIGLAIKSLSQAENYSDIVLDNLSLVYLLVVVHGSWNMLRLIKIIYIYFYKHFLYTVLTLQTQFLSAFSAFSLIDPKLAMFNHVVITGIPALVLGVFDEHNSQEEIVQYPHSFICRISKKYTYFMKLIRALIQAAIHSGVIFYMVGYLDVLNSDGFTNSSSISGIAYYITLLLTTLLQIFIIARTLNWIFIVSLVGAIGLLIEELVMVSEVKTNETDYHSEPIKILRSPVLLITILTIPLICCIISYAFTVYKTVFNTHNNKVHIQEKISEYPQLRLHQFKDTLTHLYSRSQSSTYQDQKDAYAINKYFLYFQNKQVEIKYREDYYYENIKILKLTVLVIWMLLLLWAGLEIWYHERSIGWVIASCILSVGFGVFWRITYTERFRLRYVKYLHWILTVGIIVNFLYHVTLYHENALGSGVEFNVCIAALSFLWLNVDFRMSCGCNILNITLALVVLFIKTDYSKDESIESFIRFLWKFSLLITITIICALVGYQADRSRREHFKLLQTTEIEIQKSKSIIGYLLPQFIIKRVSDGVRYIAEDQGTVSVLFCDICDFDQICAEMQPIELTCFLDDLFKKFDQLCQSFGVTKIETVGKTYMACAGLKDSELDIDSVLRTIPHARRTLELGFAMVRYANGILLDSGDNLSIKIGINSGPVVAGVVGFHKPQFSLVGDTVNTASRMCSLSPTKNAIQISENTHDLVQECDDYRFTEDSIEVKGKGTMTVYVAEEVLIKENYYEHPSLDIPVQSDSQYLNVPNLQTFFFGGSNSSPMVLSTPIIKKSSLNSSESDILQNVDNNSLQTRRRSSLFISLEIDKVQDIFKRADDSLIETTQLVSFCCRETKLQKKFRLKYGTHNYFLILASIIIATAQLCLLLILAIIKFNLVDEEETVEEIVLRCIGMMGCGPVIYLFRRMNVKYWFPWVITVVYMHGSIVALIPFELGNTRDTSLSIMELMLFMLLICYASGLFLKHVNLVLILQIILWIIIEVAISNIRVTIMTIYILGFAAINCFTLYNRETLLRAYSNIKYIADKEIEKTDKLLIQMMPPLVYENLRDDKFITDRLTDVTLIYADIVGFTAWSSDKRPQEVVGMLSELFTRFDKMCVELNVYKVHTIGDCYVVMSYTGKAKSDITQECLKMVKMAESMIKIIKDINYENDSQLNMRIGMHTGEVIAGIIGTHIIRYDIYGPDALIANKMESSGHPGKINVSDVTKTILEKYCLNDYVFEFNKEIELPTVDRTHDCYYLKSVERMNLSE